MRFKNKVVLITGGGSGIGAATAEQFSKEGANIALVGRNEANLREVAQKCEQYGTKTLVIKADISKNNEIGTIVERVIEKFGKIDVLVNNAAVFKVTSILDPKAVEIYDEVINTNLRATIYLTNLAAPYLMKTKGNIINISSVLGQTLAGVGSFMMYCISKSGLNQFTRAVALELAEHQVRVNAVSPGPVRTNMLTSIDPSTPQDDYKERTALNQILEPEEIAEVILFLASDKAKNITGVNYTVDGGMLLKN